MDAVIDLYQGIIGSDAHDTPKCVYVLGKMYRDGQFVEQDIDKATSYYKIVVEKAFSDNLAKVLRLSKEDLEKLA